MTRWLCIRAKGFYSWLGFKGVVVSVLRVITVLVGLYDYSLLISVFSLFKRGLIYVFNLFSSGPDSSGAGTDTGAAVAIKDSAAALAVGGTDSFLSVCNSGEVAAIGSEGVEGGKGRRIYDRVVLSGVLASAGPERLVGAGLECIKETEQLRSSSVEGPGDSALIAKEFIRRGNHLRSSIKQSIIIVSQQFSAIAYLKGEGLDPLSLSMLPRSVITFGDGQVLQLVILQGGNVVSFRGLSFDNPLRIIRLEDSFSLVDSLDQRAKIDYFDRGVLKSVDEL